MAGGRQGTPGFDPDRLRQQRQASAWTQARLAAAAAVSKREIGEWESGRRVPQVDTVAALARALGISPLELVQRDEDGQLTLQQLRIDAGLSQLEAGARAGLPRATYSLLERGEKTTLSPDDISALAAAFDVGEDDIRTAYAASRSQYLQRRADRERAD